MIQIHERVYEDLTPERFEEIIDEIAAGKWPETGPQNGRKSSEPLGGPTTLTDESLYNKGSDAEKLIAAALKGKGRAKKAPAKKSAAATKAGKAATARGKAKAPAKPRASAKSGATAKAKATAKAARPKTPSARAVESATPKKPRLHKTPPKKVDDLKLIAGVGPKLEKLLNELGVYTFRQIAGWGPAEIKWVDDHLKFKGRIVRDKWIEQADALAAGGEEEYIRRFGKKPR
jgi:NADH-quinone oxidoreductase subunit E